MPMHGTCRHHFRGRESICKVLLCTALLACSSTAFGQFATNDVRTFDDANLYSIQFLDANEGWAVGDQGTVWHTANGGKLWERQPNGIRATLTCIEMRDHRFGYIAARSCVPFTARSEGFLLST